MLQIITVGHKYDQKLDKCIGIAITPDEGKYTFTDWCVSTGEWQYVEELEKEVKKLPLRPVKSGNIPTYTFKNKEN